MAETDFDAVVTAVMGGAEVGFDPAGPGSDHTVHQLRDADGIVHTIRNPELCLTVYPGARFRLTIERGSHVEQESQLPVDVPDGVDDVEAAIAQIIALRVAEIATQHGRQVIRVANVGPIGPAIADALREAGFYVVEFNL